MFWRPKIIAMAREFQISERTLEALADANSDIQLPDIRYMSAGQIVNQLMFRENWNWPKNIQDASKMYGGSIYEAVVKNAKLSTDLEEKDSKAGEFNKMWKGLVILLLMLGGAYAATRPSTKTSPSRQPKYEPPKPRIIALAVFAGRARMTGINPNDAVELFEDRFAWWAGDEAQWTGIAGPKVRAGLEEKDYSPDVRSEDDKLAVVVFRDSRPDSGLIASPKDVRAA